MECVIRLLPNNKGFLNYGDDILEHVKVYRDPDVVRAIGIGPEGGDDHLILSYLSLLHLLPWSGFNPALQQQNTAGDHTSTYIVLSPCPHDTLCSSPSPPKSLNSFTQLISSRPPFITIFTTGGSTVSVAREPRYSNALMVFIDNFSATVSELDQVWRRHRPTTTAVVSPYIPPYAEFLSRFYCEATHFFFSMVDCHHSDPPNPHDRALYFFRPYIILPYIIQPL